MMNADLRIYQYKGILNIKRSQVLETNVLPKDDSVEWLFLIADKKEDKRYTFFYKIEHSSNVLFESPFFIQLAFLMDEVGKLLNQIYDVLKRRRVYL